MKLVKLLLFNIGSFIFLVTVIASVLVYLQPPPPPPAPDQEFLTPEDSLNYVLADSLVPFLLADSLGEEVQRLSGELARKIAALDSVRQILAREQAMVARLEKEVNSLTADLESSRKRQVDTQALAQRPAVELSGPDRARLAERE